MNKLNTETFQIPKISTYEGRRQDHGTAGIEDALRIKRGDREERREESERRGRKIARQVLREGMDEYLESLSTSELEDAANEILGESDNHVTESNERTKSASDEEIDAYADKQSEIAAADAQAEAANDALQDREVIANMREFGARGTQTRKYRERSATLDPSYDEDDTPDFVDGFHITDRP